MIAHQGNQWRHNNGKPLADDRGQLIAKRFARTRRHDRKNIFSREHGFENFLLSRPKLREAEHPFQRLFRLVHARVHGVPVANVVALTS
jgi:hypothetical protein